MMIDYVLFDWVVLICVMLFDLFEFGGIIFGNCIVMVLMMCSWVGVGDVLGVINVIYYV